MAVSKYIAYYDYLSPSLVLNSKSVKTFTGIATSCDNLESELMFATAS